MNTRRSEWEKWGEKREREREESGERNNASIKRRKEVEGGTGRKHARVYIDQRQAEAVRETKG